MTPRGDTPYEEGANTTTEPVVVCAPVAFSHARTLSSPKPYSIWRFLGPALLVSVGYMDPGNWATDLEGGAGFGYRLIWVLLASNLMALLLQNSSASPSSGRASVGARETRRRTAAASRVGSRWRGRDHHDCARSECAYLQSWMSRGMKTREPRRQRPRRKRVCRATRRQPCTTHNARTATTILAGTKILLRLTYSHSTQAPGTGPQNLST